MDNVHIIGGWWIVFFVLPFLFLRRSRWRSYREPQPRPPELDESVRARLELVDQLETRVAELENRLDFADRREERLESR
jgi:hypothetical protein